MIIISNIITIISVFATHVKLMIIFNSSLLLLFRFLENNLDTYNFRVVMVGDFNAPGFDWPMPIIILNLREMRSTLPRVY
jgi:hypothetical protein